MEIKRMRENQIRCALSEEEIRELGYDIDDIIGNTEVTQKFMRSVVELVEEHEHISLDDFSPMVKAELMQDHSMAITFGGETEMNFKNLIDTVGQLMSQAAPEKLNEFRQMNREEKKNMIDEFLQKYAEKSQMKEQKRETSGELSQEQENARETRQKKTTADTNQSEEEDENTAYESSVVFGLAFDSIDEIVRLFRAGTFGEKIPQNSLYKMKDKYYLLMDFIHFSKADLRPFAFIVVEYNKDRFADTARIAFIKEHGKCIVENEALQTLMQL